MISGKMCGYDAIFQEIEKDLSYELGFYFSFEDLISTVVQKSKESPIIIQDLSRVFKL
jgi:hypothetical protein